MIVGEAIVIREKPKLRHPFDVEGEEVWEGFSDS